MRPELALALREALGAKVRHARSVPGGDINEAYAVELDDGQAVFVKANRRADPQLFAAEAQGLSWLAEAGALRVPRVLAVSSPEDAGPHFLVLEYLDDGPRVREYDELLGRGLALLHQASPARFGLARDNFVGLVPQANAERSTWAQFYREQRLVPLIRRGAEAGHLDRVAVTRCQRLLSRLDELVGPPEPPARLHGDLWGGNLHVDAAGAPCLIDPAVYGGHREVDLAMLRLFSGFTPRVLAAYQEVSPLAAGHEERVALYQLYPLLVHVVLFGAGYVPAVLRALSRYE